MLANLSGQVANLTIFGLTAPKLACNLRSRKLVKSRSLSNSIKMQEIKTLHTLPLFLRELGERAAVIAFQKDGKEQWSFTRLAEQSSRVAAGLMKAGVGKGDHIALVAENRPEWLAACLGILAAGGVAVPVDVQLAADALRHILHDSGAHVVFTTKRLHERVKQAMGRRHCRYVLLDERATGAQSWEDLLDEPREPSASVSPEDRAVLFYTSGTTGPPKGVPLTHRNLAFQLNAIAAADLVTSADRVLLPLPLHHVYPFTIGILTPLTLGVPIVIPETLTGPQLTRALREGDVTIIVGVPRLYGALYAAIESRAKSKGRISAALFQGALALSTALARRRVRIGRLLFRRVHREMGPRLRVLASGGAPLEPELAWNFEGLGWLVGTGYGLTETSPLLTLDKPGQARIGSVGRPIPGLEIRIDKVEQPLRAPSGNDKEGEIVARGPSVFAGYHHLPDKTKEAFTADGWFRTGDLGRIDQDGYLYITGRVKTLIVLEGGEKVQPDDLEQSLQQASGVREVGVLMRDKKLVAVIRPARGAGAAKDDDGEREAVRKALEARSKSLPSYQRIVDFVLTREPLPRTQLGKIRREELGELYDQLAAGRAKPAKAGPISEEEMAPDDRALLDEPAARKTWKLLAVRFSDQRLTPDTSPQLDLGIDSLEWLGLTTEIRNQVGIELSEEAITRIETVRDLLREVAEHPEAVAAGPVADPLEEPEQVLDDEQKWWLAPQRPSERIVARCLYALDWLLVHGAFRLSVHGRWRLPEKGPFVLSPNHVSYLDSFVLASVLDFKVLNETYWAGWTGVAFGPLFRLLRRLCHVVPIDPDKAAASSLAFGAAVLRSKHNMVWYPEGGHSETGELGPLKLGTGMLLHRYPVPVVPVRIKGTRDALPPGRWVPRPGRYIQIVFGAPLDPKELERQGPGDEPSERITNALRDKMAEL
jgi:long-chain acyl-CoA synthetase